MSTVEFPKVALFDLDDTIAPSFEPPSDEMITRVIALLARMPVAIVTGRDFPWMNKDFLPKVAAECAGDFYVISESGAQCSYWNGSEWQEMYEHAISAEERARIHQAIVAAVEQTGVLAGLQRFGEQFVDRKAAVAFSCTGWLVPKELRDSWDPGNKRRSVLRERLATQLPEYEVMMGGATTVDVTKQGINKAFGIRWLCEHTKIAPEDMLYIGDSLFPGGNDYIVIGTGVQTRATSGPEETLRIIDELLAARAT